VSERTLNERNGKEAKTKQRVWGRAWGKENGVEEEGSEGKGGEEKGRVRYLVHIPQ